MRPWSGVSAVSPSIIFDLVDADAELFGRDLRNGDAQPWPRSTLPQNTRDGAVGVDGKKGIDLLGIEHARRGRRALRESAVAQAGERKADGERAALEQGAAGETRRF